MAPRRRAVVFSLTLTLTLVAFVPGVNGWYWKEPVSNSTSFLTSNVWTYDRGAIGKELGLKLGKESPLLGAAFTVDNLFQGKDFEVSKGDHQLTAIVKVPQRVERKTYFSLTSEELSNNRFVEGTSFEIRGARTILNTKVLDETTFSKVEAAASKVCDYKFVVVEGWYWYIDVSYACEVQVELRTPWKLSAYVAFAYVGLVVGLVWNSKYKREWRLFLLGLAVATLLMSQANHITPPVVPPVVSSSNACEYWAAQPAFFGPWNITGDGGCV